jgi:hypothetical protein
MSITHWSEMTFSSVTGGWGAFDRALGVLFRPGGGPGRQ